MSGTEGSNWHGIPRDKIPWLPTVDDKLCIACGLCFVTCGRGVYTMAEGVAVVTNGMNCMVGCSTCANICPVHAIRFPPSEIIQWLAREHAIFAEVLREAREKRTRAEVLDDRSQAARKLSRTARRAHFEVAGRFGEKRFLAKLADLVADKPADIVDLHLRVMSVSGARDGAPSFMAFDVTAHYQTDLESFISDLRELIRDNELLLVTESTSEPRVSLTIRSDDTERSTS